MFLVVLLVVAQLRGFHSLICATNGSFEISRSELLSNNSLFILREHGKQTAQNSISNSVCHVTIIIDCYQEDSNVTVTYGSGNNRTGNYFAIETLFPLSKENDSIHNTIDYTCSSYDFCDRRFVQTWIRLLVSLKQDLFHNTLINILGSGVRSDQCFTENQLVECSSGMCAASYNPDINNTTVEIGCMGDDPSLSTGLFVKIKSIEFEPIHIAEFHYVCMTHACTSRFTFTRLVRETEKLFYPIKPIAEWLHSKNDFRQQLHRVYKQMLEAYEFKWEIPLKFKLDRRRTNDSWGATALWVFSLCAFVSIAFSVWCIIRCNRKPDGYRSTPTRT